MNDKALRLLGLGAKARSLVFGMDAVIGSILRGDTVLVIAATDLSEGSFGKIQRIASENEIDCERHGTIEEISKITGTVGKGIIGVTDVNLARGILDSMNCERKGF